MDLEVQVVESSFVAPSKATPRKGLWLSALDLSLANRGHTPMVYLYRSSDAATGFSDVVRLKETMAKALEVFYPLAGRLDVGGDGRTEINCNGEGALFVVARSNLTVDHFNNLKPSPELRGLFIPRIEPSSLMLAVQVTLLKCGGVALGTALHHAATDAMSAFHFFQTWAAFARGQVVVELPCHDRTLLRARSPPAVHPDALSAFCPDWPVAESTEPTVAEPFTISRAQVASLKLLCGGASTFCALSALMWQCACAARRLPAGAKARVTFSANVRRRVRPPLPDAYFGNAIISLGATGAAREVASEALASVAGRIGDAVGRMDDELVRSAIDYLELATMGTAQPPRRGSLPETELRVVSWLGMPAYDVDFGWGEPHVLSRAEPSSGGYVHLMDEGPGGSGAVRVLASMGATHIKEFRRLLHAKLA